MSDAKKKIAGGEKKQPREGATWVGVNGGGHVSHVVRSDGVYVRILPVGGAK